LPFFEWLNEDGNSVAPQLTTEGHPAVHDLLHSPTGFEKFKEQIRVSVPNTVHHLEEIWMKHSFGLASIDC
jgi:hypothetical protein